MNRVITRVTEHIVEGVRALRRVESALDAGEPERLGTTAYFAAVGNLHLMGLFGNRDDAEIQQLPERINAALNMAGIHKRNRTDDCHTARAAPCAAGAVDDPLIRIEETGPHGRQALPRSQRL